MEYKDYYEVLGLSKSADDQAIKKAFRRLAREYHPDVNDDPQAETRFKEINEAHEVLKDPEKRARYDQLGSRYKQWEQRGGQPGGFDWSPFTSGQGGSANDIFSDFFQSVFGGGRYAQQAGSTVNLDELFGGRGMGQQQQRSYDLNTDAEITLEEAYHGTSRLVTNNGRRLQVKIPRGAKTGTKVRLAGEGHQGRGDLYIRVLVQDDPNFTREKDNLHEEIQIDLYTAILGGEVQIVTMTGPVTLKIGEGTQSGQKIRIRSKGMPNLRKPDTYGDLYLHVYINIPTNLSAKERALFRELASFR